MKPLPCFAGLVLSAALSLQVGAEVTATHSVTGPYTPGGELTVSCTLTYTDEPSTMSALAFQAAIPAGWVFMSGSYGVDAVPNPKPRSNDMVNLEWTWQDIPPSPVSFSYTLRTTNTSRCAQAISASSLYRATTFQGARTAPAEPATLFIPSTLDTRLLSVQGDLAFGVISMGATAERTLMLSNAGSCVLTLINVDGPQGFEFLAATNQLAPGAPALPVTVRFTGANPPGSQDFTVTLASDDTSAQFYPLPLTAFIAVRELGFNPSVLDFGSIEVGTVSQRILMLTNTGNDLLSITNISYPQGFSGQTSLAIQPNQTAGLLISFQPAAAGQFSPPLVFHSDATQSAQNPSLQGAAYWIPVTVTQPPLSLTVTQGVASAQFSVQVAGSLPYAFQWYHSGNPVANGAGFSGATTPTLTLASPLENHSGPYYVIITNMAGSVTSPTGQLSVLVGPGLRTLPAAQTSAQNGSATFLVEATGTQPLTYRWKRDGAYLSDSANVAGSLTNRLVLINLDTNADDNARFSVEVSNMVGLTNSPEVVLTVVPGDAAPQITSQPASLSVPVGQMASFEVRNTGYPAPVYQWFLNGAVVTNSSRVTGAATASLILDSVANSDGGQYVVLVSNRAGSVTSSVALLTPVTPPTAQIAVTNIDVNQGQSAAVVASLTGTEPLVKQWFKDGSPLQDQTNTQVLFTNAQTVNAGEYFIVVTNLAGSATSALARVTVFIAPTVFVHFTNIDVNLGEPCYIFAHIMGTYPLSFQWFKDGSPLAGKTNGELNFTAVQAADTGSYYVVVTNRAGSVTSPAVSVKVFTAPSVVLQPLSQTNCAGQTVTFTAAFAGTDPIALQWTANGVPVPGATTATLTRTNVQAPDSGVYILTASNRAGTNTVAAHLTVNVPPTITLQPADATITPRSTASFFVAADGGTLAYQWLKNGATIPGATGTTYSVSNATTNDVASYSVRVSNGCGQTNSRGASLTIVDRALQIVGGSALPGSNIVVPVNLVGAGNETGAVFTLVWDTNVLALAGIVSGSAVTNSPIIATQAPGQFKFWIAPNGAAFNAGLNELIQLHLTVSSCVSNTVVPLFLAGTNDVRDASGAILVCDSQSGQVYVGGGVPVPPTASTNTGFFEGQVTVNVPPGGLPASQALRILVTGLGTDTLGYPITIYNAAGTNNGVPYLQVNGPLAQGLITLPVRYAVVDRKTQPAPVFVVQLIGITPVSIPAAGSPIPVNLLYTNGAVRLQFMTVFGKTNYIQYRSTVATNRSWTTVSPSIRGFGGTMTWTDDGAPKTESRPGTTTNRFYRVLVNP